MMQVYYARKIRGVVVAGAYNGAVNIFETVLKM